MASEPSEWALETARKLTPIELGFKRKGSKKDDGPGWHTTRDAIAAALDTARAEGRREGLREARQVCMDNADACERRSVRHDEQVTSWKLGQAILALADGEVKRA